MILSPMMRKIPVHFEGVSISQWTPIPSETSCKGVTLFSGCCNATTKEFFGSHCSRSDREHEGRRETRGKGETGTKYKELVPSFFWLSGLWRREGRGGDGQGRAN